MVKGENHSFRLSSDLHGLTVVHTYIYIHTQNRMHAKQQERLSGDALNRVQDSSDTFRRKCRVSLVFMSSDPGHQLTPPVVTLERL